MPGVGLTALQLLGFFFFFLLCWVFAIAQGFSLVAEKRATL